MSAPALVGPAPQGPRPPAARLLAALPGAAGPRRPRQRPATRRTRLTVVKISGPKGFVARVYQPPKPAQAPAYQDQQGPRGVKDDNGAPHRLGKEVLIDGEAAPGPRAQLRSHVPGPAPRARRDLRRGRLANPYRRRTPRHGHDARSGRRPHTPSRVEQRRRCGRSRTDRAAAMLDLAAGERISPAGGSCAPATDAPTTGAPRHPGGTRNSNSGRSHGTAGGFANAVPVRTAPTRW